MSFIAEENYVRLCQNLQLLRLVYAIKSRCVKQEGMDGAFHTLEQVDAHEAVLAEILRFFPVMVRCSTDSISNTSSATS